MFCTRCGRKLEEGEVCPCMKETGKGQPQTRPHIQLQKPQQGGVQGVHDLAVLEQLHIPVQGKAVPNGAALGVVEGEHDQHKDGGVQEQERQPHKDPSPEGWALL